LHRDINLQHPVPSNAQSPRYLERMGNLGGSELVILLAFPVIGATVAGVIVWLTRRADRRGP